MDILPGPRLDELQNRAILDVRTDLLERDVVIASGIEEAVEIINQERKCLVFHGWSSFYNSAWLDAGTRFSTKVLMEATKDDCRLAQQTFHQLWLPLGVISKFRKDLVVVLALTMAGAGGTKSLEISKELDHFGSLRKVTDGKEAIKLGDSLLVLLSRAADFREYCLFVQRIHE